MDLSRRQFLNGVAVVSGVSIFRTGCATQSASVSVTGGLPGAVNWQPLRDQVGERLIQVQSPLAPCMTDGGSAACSAALQSLKNPFFNEDEPGATQTTGWLDAWTPAVSPYAVAAESARDIVAAVNFARDNRIKLVVKGTGHDYLGRSNAPDSLLVWTHRMRKVTTHDAFKIAGGPSDDPGVPAISVEAGARWLEAYTAATAAGRYVQGGGCTSVGAAGGFIQGGGIGSFSKRYGPARRRWRHLRDRDAGDALVAPDPRVGWRAARDDHRQDRRRLQGARRAAPALLRDGAPELSARPRP